MPTLTYDPSKVVVSVGGVTIGGYADGTFVSVERNSEAYTKIVGADGEVSRVRSTDKSGLLSLTLAQTSNSNDVLTGFALQDEKDNSAVVPVQIKDLSGRSVFFSGEGWIRKTPRAQYGNKLTNREWVIDLALLEFFQGGN